jgi:hypothetical protein
MLRLVFAAVLMAPPWDTILVEVALACNREAAMTLHTIQTEAQVRRKPALAWPGHMKDPV